MSPLFRWYLVFFGISLSGDWMRWIGSSAYLTYTLNGSPMMLALLGCSQATSVLFVGALPAAAIKRFQFRPVLITANLVLCLCAWTAAWGAAAGWLSYPLLVFLCAVIGFSHAFSRPAEDIFVTTLVSKEELLRANSYISSVAGIARCLFAFLAGVFLVWWGPAAVFAFDGASFLLMALFVTLQSYYRGGERGQRALGATSEDSDPETTLNSGMDAPHERSTLLQSWSAALRLSRRDPLIRFYLQCELILGVAFVSWPIIPELCRDIWRVSQGWVGTIMAAGGLGSLISLELFRRMRMTGRSHIWGPRYLPLLIILCPLSLFGIAMAWGPKMAAIFYLMGYGCYAPFEIICRTVMQQHRDRSVAVNALSLVRFGLVPWGRVAVLTTLGGFGLTGQEILACATLSIALLLLIMTARAKPHLRSPFKRGEGDTRVVEAKNIGTAVEARNTDASVRTSAREAAGKVGSR